MKENLTTTRDYMSEEEIKDAIVLAKEKKIIDMENWLIQQDAEFVAKSKYHYHIFFNGRLILQLWPTTDKFIVQSTKQTYIGLNKFKNAYKKITEVVL